MILLLKQLKGFIVINCIALNLPDSDRAYGAAYKHAEFYNYNHSRCGMWIFVPDDDPKHTYTLSGNDLIGIDGNSLDYLD